MTILDLALSILFVAASISFIVVAWFCEWAHRKLDEEEARLDAELKAMKRNVRRTMLGKAGMPLKPGKLVFFGKDGLLYTANDSGRFIEGHRN